MNRVGRRAEPHQAGAVACPPKDRQCFDDIDSPSNFMKKPLFYSFPPAGNKLPLKAIVRAMRNGGKPSGDLFKPVREILPAKYLFYLSSGRAALWLLLKALSLIQPDKKEVIIPAYTCPAVASAVLKAGLKVILCDINLDNFGFSKGELGKKVSKNTLAVILVHLFGYPANIQEVKEACRGHEIYLIEDAAQAFGNSVVDSPERKLGLQTDAGFFSFGRGKPISILHGGLLVTESKEIFLKAQEIYQFLNGSERFAYLKYDLFLSSYKLFSNPYLYWIPQHIPSLHLGETIFEPDFRTSRGLASTALLLKEMIASIEEEKQIRREHSKWYFSNLKTIADVQHPINPDFPFLRYPILIKNRLLRDKLLKKLTLQGTGAAQFYPCPLNEIPVLNDILKDSNSYPKAKEIADRLITLPVHSGVSTSKLQKIGQIIKRSVH